MLSAPPAGKPPLFIMLDGTGQKRVKCSAKALIWMHYRSFLWICRGFRPIACVEAHADDQYCTAEVAIALLDSANDNVAAQALGDHFSLFRERYLAGKPHHPSAITANEAESV